MGALPDGASAQAGGPDFRRGDVELLTSRHEVVTGRSPPLGKSSRFLLAGLADDQLRVYLDGLALELVGFPLGVWTVPVGLIERVDVHRGAVPLTLAPEAHAAALNLVSDTRYLTRLGASYQIGSFGTHRASVDGRYRHAPSGFVVGGSAFVDLARNDYPVDVEVADADGLPQPATVSRFHDRYLAYGGSVELGFVDQPWARRLLLRAFVSRFEQELQHNAFMTVPYGEATDSQSVYGASGRYEQALLDNLDLTALAAYSRRDITFTDESGWVYDWYGERIRERRVPGEVNARPTDQTIFQDNGFGRLTLAWTVRPRHVLKLAVSPTYVARHGEQRAERPPDSVDPLSGRRDQLTLVSGLAYAVSAWSRSRPAGDQARPAGPPSTDILWNELFVKDYVYRSNADVIFPAGNSQSFDESAHAVGAGDLLKLTLTDWLGIHTSYEYALRAPRPDEVFGDGVLVQENVELKPERSHNLNLSIQLSWPKLPIGALSGEVGTFFRLSDQFITPATGADFTRYENIDRVRTAGTEALWAWLSPGQWVGADAALTFQDVRNVSGSGMYAAVEGDRVPNRPWLITNFGAHVRIGNLPGHDDALRPYYAGRYVHGYVRGWESIGAPEFRQEVPAQLTHNLGIAWNLARSFARINAAFEVQNVADERVYDRFGVQWPGRSFLLRLTGEI